jgi:hypothetical protein
LYKTGDPELVAYWTIPQSQLIRSSAIGEPLHSLRQRVNGFLATEVVNEPLFVRKLARRV